MSSQPGEKSAADYWSRAARAKTFSHELDLSRLGALLPPRPRILDIGCGWGRSMIALRHGGFHDVVGVDFAHGMLARGVADDPTLRLLRADARRLPFRAGTFDGAVILAVLTAVPSDADQRAIISEVGRVLRPSGLLVVSDLLLNTDERNVARYRQWEAARQRAGEAARYGVFELPEGVTLRHHDRAWLTELFAGFQEEAFEAFTATTMNGHTSNAFRAFLRAT